MSETIRSLDDQGRRNPLLWMIGIVAVLLVVVVVVSRLVTDYWWFDSVRFETVFTTRLVTQVLLFFGFGLVMGGALFASLEIAYRLRPKVRRANLDSEFLIQARDVLDARSRTLMLVPSRRTRSWRSGEEPRSARATPTTTSTRPSTSSTCRGGGSSSGSC